MGDVEITCLKLKNQHKYRKSICLIKVRQKMKDKKKSPKTN